MPSPLTQHRSHKWPVFGPGSGPAAPARWSEAGAAEPAPESKCIGFVAAVPSDSSGVALWLGGAVVFLRVAALTPLPALLRPVVGSALPPARAPLQQLALLLITWC